MLEDISILLSLCVNGKPIIGSINISKDVLTNFLGREPPLYQTKGRTVKISWLKKILKK